MKDFLKKATTGMSLAAITVSNWVAPVMAYETAISLDEIDPTYRNGSGIRLASNAMVVFRNVITLVIIVAALLTLFYLIMGAINWITSGGDKGKVEDARNRITSAVIGLLLLAAVWAIFQLVLQIALGSDVNGLSIPTLSAS